MRFLVFGVFLAFVLALPLLRARLAAWRRARRLAKVAGSGAGELAPFLGSRDDLVREAAAARLASLVPGTDALARLSALPREGARALVRALGEKEPALVRAAHDAEKEARWRLLLAQGIAASDEGARALVAFAADARLSDDERAEALDALERSPRAAVREVALAALEPESAVATPELLWALSDAGEPDDALLAARHVAAPSFPVASSACEVIFALLERGTPRDGARLASLLVLGRTKIREVHAEGENPLADGLVERLDELAERFPRAPVPA